MPTVRCDISFHVARMVGRKIGDHHEMISPRLAGRTTKGGKRQPPRSVINSGGVLLTKTSAWTLPPAETQDRQRTAVEPVEHVQPVP